MKKIKKQKLQFEKFTVAELDNLKTIKGGQNDVPTVTIDLTITGGNNNGGGAGNAGGGSSIQCSAG